MAGVKVQWAFDNDLQACRAYRSNFGDETDTYVASVEEFANSLKGDSRVDMLHISPPCCFFSRNHTVSGKNDERNRATLFCIGRLLRRVRPRIVTLGEVEGQILDGLWQIRLPPKGFSGFHPDGTLDSRATSSAPGALRPRDR